MQRHLSHRHDTRATTAHAERRSGAPRIVTKNPAKLPARTAKAGTATGAAAAAGAAATGASQTGIRKIQEALNQQGFNVGNADGKLGQRTKNALIAFQKQRGLHTTGKADRKTRQALLAATPAAPPAPEQTPAAAERPATEPGTTGLGRIAPPPARVPQPLDSDAPPPTVVPAAPAAPEIAPLGRVPAGAPQDDDTPEDER
jgi:peptidoglycan hydrolase-like protein with peptidoglycan-binding domain